MVGTAHSEPTFHAMMASASSSGENRHGIKANRRALKQRGERMATRAGEGKRERVKQASAIVRGKRCHDRSSSPLMIEHKPDWV